MYLNLRFCMIALLLCSLGQLDLFGQGKPIAGASKVEMSAADVLAYWTPERLASAQPRVLAQDDNIGPIEESVSEAEPIVSSPGQLPSRSGAARTFADTQFTASLPNGEISPMGYTYPYPFTRFTVPHDYYRYPYQAAGKLFFTLGGQNWVCSASVMHPHLVLTARHCIFGYVHPSGGQFATNVVFYPSWFNGPEPELNNGWPARRLYTWVANAPNWKWDIGFIQMFDDDRVGCGRSAGGWQIGDYTGWLGWWYGGDYSKRHWNALGYPADPPFTGQWMVVAQSSTGEENPLGEVGTIGAGNDMTGGASGGPWILDFVPDAAGAMNYANGVNSYQFTTPARPLAMQSPTFHGDNFNNLRVGAEALPCP